jgi:hypothetical protein
MGFTITWDDQNSRPNIIEGVSNIGGGDQAGLISTVTGYDESAPPISPPIDNEEFDNEELAPRWKFFGNLTEGGVARGASFTSPLNSAKYSLTNRRGFFQLQPVADPLTTDGQGIYAELDDGSKNAGNAPTNWKMSAGLFVEIDASTLPSGDIDSARHQVMHTFERGVGLGDFEFLLSKLERHLLAIEMSRCNGFGVDGDLNPISLG